MAIRQFTVSSLASSFSRLEPVISAGGGEFQGLANEIYIQPRPTNTGVVYIGIRGDMNPTGFVGIIGVIRPVNLSATKLGVETLTISDPSGANSLDPSKIFMKPEVDNEGVLGFINEK